MPEHGVGPDISRPLFCHCGDELWDGHDDRRHRERHARESFEHIQRYGLCAPCDLGLPSGCTCPAP